MHIDLRHYYNDREKLYWGDKQMNLYNTIKNEKEYWLVDQVKQEGISTEAYMEMFQKLLGEWQEGNIGYISVLMDEVHEQELKQLGFTKISTIVEYTRTLEDIPILDGEIQAYSLSESNMSDQVFASLYQACRSGSANKNKQQTIEQIMQSLHHELGAHWRDHCFYFTSNNEKLGIAIPHIEMGTADEGRMFYFGVVPEWRGKGYGAKLHLHTLSLLKLFHATYYVGSTDEANTNMIAIFKRNGCMLRDRKGIYRLENKINAE